jgi:very-short-patch-repair endonuclease
MPTEADPAAISSQLDRSRADRRVAVRAGKQWGVLSTRELRACGLTHGQIATRRRIGHLHRIYRATWAVGHPNLPWEGALLAAVKACGPNALLSHWSAAELWRFVDRLDGLPHVTVLGRVQRRHRGIKVHTSSRLTEIDCRELDAIPVTSAPRTLLDLAASLDPARTRRAVRRALGAGRITVRQIGQVLDRYPGVRGSRVLHDAVMMGAEPTRSDAESDVLDIVVEAGFDRPDVNRPLSLGNRRLVPDLRWPRQRLVLEIDSTAWHTDPLARLDDRERQRLLETNGETVLRVHWRDAVLRPARLAAVLRDAGAPRG